MRLKAVLCGALLLAVSCDGFDLAGGAETELTIGHAVLRHSYPWQVRLYGSADDAQGYCGGSLIAPQWVLTAAHCVIDPKTGSAVEKIIVGYGNTKHSETRKVESAKIVVHPDYSATSKVDLALIKLKLPLALDQALPIPLADSSSDRNLLVPKTRLVIVGWGVVWDPEEVNDIDELLAEISTPSKHEENKAIGIPIRLHEIDVEVIDSQYCNARLESLSDPDPAVDAHEFCVIQPTPQENACIGDSGGPIIVKADVPEDYLQGGIVRWGRYCGVTDYPGVQTSVAPFLDWISEQLKIDRAS